MNKKDPKWFKSFISDSELIELENDLNSLELTKAVSLDKCTVVLDPKKFIETHLKYIRANRNNKTFEPYLNRLLKLKELLWK